jgi:hypothetical protein
MALQYYQNVPNVSLRDARMAGHNGKLVATYWLWEGRSPRNFLDARVSRNFSRARAYVQGASFFSFVIFFLAIEIIK